MKAILIILCFFCLLVGCIWMGIGLSKYSIAPFLMLSVFLGMLLDIV